ncbi:MAG: endo-1,4-beta-xylanase [Verrucomicrobiota bacterium]
MAVAAAVIVSIAPQAQAESQHLGNRSPNTAYGLNEVGEGKIFDHLIVQGQWVFRYQQNGTFLWNIQDGEMDLAAANNMHLKYQGVWYPSFSKNWHTPEIMKPELERYTRAVFDRYYSQGKKIDVLRVINEIGSDINRRPDLEVGLLDGYDPVQNPNPVDETGYDWLINLFAMVRGIADEYDPDVQLFINDYGLLGGGNNKRANLVNIINLVNNAEGGPYIDAVGCQGHGMEPTSGDTIKGNLDFLTERLEHDVDIYITEYDVNYAGDDQQLATYMRQFPVMWEHPSVTSVALWGFEEGHMWKVKPNAFLMRADGSDRPAMTWLRAYMNSKNTAPVTSFNLPVGDFLPLGADVNVQVQANDRDGVTKVDFYLDDVFVGTQAKTYDMDGYGEHDFVLSNLTAGDYTLKAVAYDTNGLSTTVEKTITVGSLVPPTGPADLIIYTEADATLRIGNFANRNYGGSSTITAWSKGGVSGRREAYLRFNVSSLPENVDSVWMELTPSSEITSSAQARVRFVPDDSWNESGGSGITYNTRPLPSKTLSIVDGIIGTDSVKFLVGNQVAEETAGDGKLSVTVDGYNSGVQMNFHSRDTDADSTLRPRLLVYLTPLPPYEGGLPVSDGLMLHLDASTLTDRNEGDEVLEWPNLVPGGRDATTTNDIAPLFAEGFFNGSDALRFDGIDDWMNIGNLVTESDGAEIFVITQASETDGEIDQRLISAFDTGANDTTAPNWAILREDDSNGKPLAMAPQLKILSGPDLHAAGVKLGRNGNASQNFFDGDIAEVVIFDRELEYWEHYEVAYHLLQKYGISSGTYPNPAPETPVLVGIPGESSVSLDWQDSNQVGMTFNVYRKSSPEEAFGPPIATDVIPSEYTDESVVSGTTYFYAVSSVDANEIEWRPSDPFEVTTLGTPPPGDGELPIRGGLVVHLDASSLTEQNGDPISSWGNQVVDGNDATNSGDARPTLIQDALNGAPVVRFDGIDDWMDIGNLQSETGDIEIFLITQAPETDGSTYQRIIANYGAGDNDWTAPNWIMWRNQDSSGNPLVMAPQLKTASKSNVNLAGVKLGRKGNDLERFFDGDIAEVAIFNRSLKDWERNEVAYYLAQKYTVDSGSYMNPETDPDGDGENTRSELIAGTLPDDASSVLRLKLNKDQFQPDRKGIIWQSVSNRQYLVERSFDLVEWHDYLTIQGDGSEFELIDTDDNERAFYRITASEQ